MNQHHVSRRSSINAPTFSPQFLIVGNPENRRTTFFQTALGKLGFPSARVLAYVDLLTKRTSLAEHLQPGTLLRIESPGENFEVERALLREGIAETETEGSAVLSASQTDRLRFDRGLILHPRQHYLGFRNLLRQFAEEIAAVPGVTLMNSPGDIEVMFDKRLCHQRCQQHGVPVPPSLGPVGCYEELIARMVEADERRVFIKLANGSSASGVVAYFRGDDRQVAMTSAEIVRGENPPRLYNSLNVRCHTNPRDVADLINVLCREQVHVERWMPKVVLDRHGNVDLRIVVIGGTARHWVIRQSRSPLTNLHLGNRRGDRDHFLERVGLERWKILQDTCENALNAFPESLYAGVDLLLMPDLRHHAVLELNAFGDLLPNVLSEGMDTYAAEIAAVAGWELPGDNPKTPIFKPSGTLGE